MPTTSYVSVQHKSNSDLSAWIVSRPGGEARRLLRLARLPLDQTLLMLGLMQEAGCGMC